MDAQFAFLNRVRFDEKETFRHFGFTRTRLKRNRRRTRRGFELLRKSPYKDQSGTAQLFLQAINNRFEGDPQPYQSVT